MIMLVNPFLITKNLPIKSVATLKSTSLNIVKDAPVSDIIPFLSEHIQMSDQLLFLGASTDMVIKLSQLGYGTKKTGFILCVDEDSKKIEECKYLALQDPVSSKNIADGRLSFKTTDFSNMPEVCKQSSFDAIVDYGGLDSMHKRQCDSESILKCIDHLQNAVRLGNILVCLSELDKETFCSPFESRFGWVQELDGEPGEISQWYRGKSNIQATKSNFQRLGLRMYVYTNTDNC